MMTIWTPTLDPQKPSYRSIVDELASDVATGRLSEGAQLPPQRDLARALGVSLGTVTRAYSLAERRGLVRGEVGRGTFVGQAPYATLPLGELGETVRGAVNLSMTWPLQHLDPDLRPVLRRLSQDPDAGRLLAYQPNAGHPRHREAGARWAKRYGLEVGSDRVVVTAGTQHAMTVALGASLQPGDTLLCEELTYPGIRAVADFLNLELVGLPTDDEGLLPDAFEEAARAGKGSALYTIPTLQNPLATTLSLERRRAIAETAERHGVLLIEDAIHNLLLEDAPPTLASLAPERTLFLAAPSKLVAGGLRIGFLIAPRDFIESATQAIWSTTWMVAPLCAEVFAQWIEDGTADRTVRAKREESAARVALARELLGADRLRAGKSSYHAWLEIPESAPSATDFAQACLEEGVLVTASDAFLAANGQPPRAVRLSLSAPQSRETLRLGLERIATCASAPAPRVRL